MELPLIAVVDDETDLLENFETLLGDHYRVATFSSPENFLGDLPKLKEQLKIVVTDYRMPGMTGLQMIKKAYETGVQFPFVLLSGQLDKDMVIQAVNQGVFRLLEKPIDHDAIETVLDQLLMEQDLVNVRKEIHQITSKLRELYSTIRLALLPHLPDETLDRLVVDAPQGFVTEKMSFETLLDQLENRLEKLLLTEKMFLTMRETKFDT